MKFIVVIKLGGKSGEAPEISFPPREVDAVDRWGALVQAVESLGLESKFPMSYLWKRVSIVKKERRGTAVFRVEPSVVKELESKTREKKKRWKLF